MLCLEIEPGGHTMLGADGSTEPWWLPLGVNLEALLGLTLFLIITLDNASVFFLLKFPM